MGPDFSQLPGLFVIVALAGATGASLIIGLLWWIL